MYLLGFILNYIPGEGGLGMLTPTSVPLLMFCCCSAHTLLLFCCCSTHVLPMLYSCSADVLPRLSSLTALDRDWGALPAERHALEDPL